MRATLAFHAHRFRSRVVVEFGTAFEVPVELVGLYQQGGAEKRQAVGQLLNLIYDALKIVTVRAPDYDTLMVRILVPVREYIVVTSLSALPSSTTVV